MTVYDENNLLKTFKKASTKEVKETTYDGTSKDFTSFVKKKFPKFEYDEDQGKNLKADYEKGMSIRKRDMALVAEAKNNYEWKENGSIFDGSVFSGTKETVGGFVGFLKDPGPTYKAVIDGTIDTVNNNAEYWSNRVVNYGLQRGFERGQVSQDELLKQRVKYGISQSVVKDSFYDEHSVIRSRNKQIDISGSVEAISKRDAVLRSISDPKQEIAHVQMAKILGVSVDVIKNDPEMAQIAIDKINNFETTDPVRYAQLLEQAPSLKNLTKDYSTHVVIPANKHREKAELERGIGPFAGLSVFEGGNQALIGMDEANIGFKMYRGTETEEDIAKYNKLLSGKKYSYVPSGFWDETFYGFGNVTAQMGGSVLKGGVGGGVAWGAVKLLEKNPVARTFIAGSKKLNQDLGKKAFMWGMKITSPLAIFQQEAGATYFELSTFRDKFGVPMDKDVMAATATITGLTNTGIEFAQIQHISKMWGPSTNAAIKKLVGGEITTESIVKTFAGKTPIQVGAMIAKNTITNTLTLAAEETAQDFASNVTINEAKKYSNENRSTNFKVKNNSEIASDTVGSFVTNSKTMLMTGFLPAATKGVVGYKKQQKASEDLQRFDILAQNAQNDETLKNGEIIGNNVSEKHIAGSVLTNKDFQFAYIKPKDLSDAMGPDLSSFLKEINAENEYKVASDTDGRVKVPTEKLYSKVLPVKTRADLLRGKVAFGSEVESVSEIETSLSETDGQPSQTEIDNKKKQSDIKSSLKFIRGNMYGKLMDNPTLKDKDGNPLYSEREAESVAALVEARARKIANDYGIDPLDWYKSGDIKISSGNQNTYNKKAYSKPSAPKVVKYAQPGVDFVVKNQYSYDNMRPIERQATQRLIADYNAQFPNDKIWLTEGWRPQNATYGAKNSYHKTGGAVDLWSEGLINKKENRVWFLNRAKQLGFAEVLDEVENPYYNATGKHIHLADVQNADITNIASTVLESSTEEVVESAYNMVANNFAEDPTQHESNTKETHQAAISLSSFDDSVYENEFNNTYSENTDQTVYGTTETARNMVRIMEDGNIVDLVHETFHVFNNDLFRLARRFPENKQLQDDVNDFVTAFKIRPDQIQEDGSVFWDNIQSELAAKHFESYLIDGVSPNKELAKPFRDYSNWLLNVYQTQRTSELLPEVDSNMRRVFDRMFATENEISEAISLQQEASSIFNKPELSDLFSEEDLSKYKDLLSDAVNSTKDNGRKKAMRDLSNEFSKVRKEARNSFYKESFEDAKNTPFGRAVDFFTNKNISKKIELLRKDLSEENNAILDTLAMVGMTPNQLIKELRSFRDDVEFEQFKGLHKIQVGGIVDGIEQFKRDTAAYKKEIQEFATSTDSGSDIRIAEILQDYEATNAEGSIYGDQEIRDKLKEGVTKLNYEIVKEKFGEEVADAIPRNMISEKGIYDPASVFVEFGYFDEESFIDDLATSQSLSKVASAIADQKMERDYYQNEQNIKEIAKEAINNEKFFDVEYFARDILQRAYEENSQNEPSETKYTPRLKTELKETAVKNIEILDLNSALDYKRFMRDATTLGEEVVRAAKAGDFKLALQKKDSQLIQIQMANESISAAKEMKKIDKTVSRYTKPDKNGNRPLALPEELAVIIGSAVKMFPNKNSILRAYDLLPDSTKKTSISSYLNKYLATEFEDFSVDKLVKDAISEQYEMFLDGDFANEPAPIFQLQNIIENQNEQATPYSYGDFKTFRDSVKFIQKMSDLKDPGTKMFLSDQTPAEASSEIINKVDETVGRRYFDYGEKNHVAMKEYFKLGFDFVGSLYGGAFNVIRKIDGDIDGPMSKNTIQKMHEAEQREGVLKDNKNASISKITNQMPQQEKLEFYSIKYRVDELNDSFSLSDMITIVLNWGNEKNRKKLLETRGYPANAIDYIIPLLDKKHIDLIETIWSEYKNIYDERSAVHERTRGYKLKQEKSSPFSVLTKGGRIFFSGGYVPIIYDATSFDRRSGIPSRGSRPTNTNQSNTKDRTENSNGQMNLDLKKIFSNMDSAIHDIAYREASIDVSRILYNKDVSKKMKQTVGKFDYENITRAFETTVLGPEKVVGWESVAKFMRVNVIGSMMAGKISVMLQQPLDIVNATMEIGSKEIFGAAISPQLYNQAMKDSAYMRDLLEGNSDRDKADIIASNKNKGEVTAKMASRFMGGWKKTSKNNKLKKNIVSAISAPAVVVGSTQDIAIKAQNVVTKLTATPIYGAMFNKSLNKFLESGLSNEESYKKAIYEAEAMTKQIVGSNDPFHIAKIQLGNEYGKLFTTFMTPTIAVIRSFQRSVQDIQKAHKTNEGRLKAWTNLTMKLVVLSSVQGALAEVMAGRGPKDKDDKWKWFWSKVFEFYAMGTPFVIRDILEGGFNKMIGYDDGFRGANRLSLPAQSGINELFQTGKEIGKFMDGKGNPGKLLKHGWRTISYFGGFPQQANIIGFNLHDYFKTGKELTWKDFLKFRPIK